MGILTTTNPKARTTAGKQRCWWDLVSAGISGRIMFDLRNGTGSTRGSGTNENRR